MGLDPTDIPSPGQGVTPQPPPPLSKGLVLALGVVTVCRMAAISVGEERVVVRHLWIFNGLSRRGGLAWNPCASSQSVPEKADIKRWSAGLAKVVPGQTSVTVRGRPMARPQHAHRGAGSRQPRSTRKDVVWGGTLARGPVSTPSPSLPTQGVSLAGGGLEEPKELCALHTSLQVVRRDLGSFRLVP